MAQKHVDPVDPDPEHCHLPLKRCLIISIFLLLQVFDHMLKRMSYRRQKRWWNAYMLFYCRADLDTPTESITAGIQVLIKGIVSRD
jgi:hypothetical protein